MPRVKLPAFVVDNPYRRKGQRVVNATEADVPGLVASGGVLVDEPEAPAGDGEPAGKAKKPRPAKSHEAE